MNEEYERDIVSHSILNASLRLTHDHELSYLDDEELLNRVTIDYVNELMKLQMKANNNENRDIVLEQIELYKNNKDVILESRLERFIKKRDRILKRHEEDWIKVEEAYRKEEMEHLEILMSFMPNDQVIYIKRANYNDIRLVRNYLRTINLCNGCLHDDNVINKYRNLEFKLRSCENYIVIETICEDSDTYGYLVNNHNYLDRILVKIYDNNHMIRLEQVNDVIKINKILLKIYDKIQ